MARYSVKVMYPSRENVIRQNSSTNIYAVEDEGYSADPEVIGDSIVFKDKDGNIECIYPAKYSIVKKIG